LASAATCRRANEVLQAGCDFGEDRVAGLVTEDVAYEFESVEVVVQDREMFGGACAARHAMSEPIDDDLSAYQSGERVVVRLGCLELHDPASQPVVFVAERLDQRGRVARGRRPAQSGGVGPVLSCIHAVTAVRRVNLSTSILRCRCDGRNVRL
jgi:hypothetical protein